MNVTAYRPGDNGVSRVRENYAWRVVGMGLTLAPIVAAALRLLRLAWAGD